MYCSQCGKPTNNNQDLCDECKAKQGGQPVYETNAQETASVNQVQDNNNYTASNYNQNQPNYNQNPQQYNNVNQGQYNNNAQPNNNTNPNAKSKIAAGLLGIFLGAFGVHNFYLGYTGKAVAQLLITVLSCGILSWASAIWGLVEGIMILTGSTTVDGKGNPLAD